MNDHEKARYVDLIANGALRYEAAKALKIPLATVKKHYYADPDFRDAVEDAVLEGVEPVEKFLRAQALIDPAIALKYLAKKDKEQWGDQPARVEIKVQHGLDPDLPKAIAEATGLIAQLQDRRALRQPYELAAQPTYALPDITDAEVIESTDAPATPAPATLRPTAPPL